MHESQWRGGLRKRACRGTCRCGPRAYLSYGQFDPDQDPSTSTLHDRPGRDQFDPCDVSDLPKALQHPEPRTVVPILPSVPIRGFKHRPQSPRRRSLFASLNKHLLRHKQATKLRSPKTTGAERSGLGASDCARPIASSSSRLVSPSSGHCTASPMTLTSQKRSVPKQRNRLAGNRSWRKGVGSRKPQGAQRSVSETVETSPSARFLRPIRRGYRTSSDVAFGEAILIDWRAPLVGSPGYSGPSFVWATFGERDEKTVRAGLRASQPNRSTKRQNTEGLLELFNFKV